MEFEKKNVQTMSIVFSRIGKRIRSAPTSPTIDARKTGCPVGASFVLRIKGKKEKRERAEKGLRVPVYVSK